MRTAIFTHDVIRYGFLTRYEAFPCLTSIRAVFPGTWTGEKEKIAEGSMILFDGRLTAYRAGVPLAFADYPNCYVPDFFDFIADVHFSRLRPLLLAAERKLLALQFPELPK